MWSVRTLDRNISTQYFERHFKQPQLIEDSCEKTPADKLEVLKSPVVAEFLGFNLGTDYTESDLEKGLISHLQEFLVEMGRGFALRFCGNVASTGMFHVFPVRKAPSIFPVAQ